MKKKIIPALLLSATIAAAFCSCGNTGGALSSQASNVTTAADTEAIIRDGVAFSDLAYERYDDTNLQNLLSDLTEKCQDESNADAVADLLDRIDKEYLAMEQSYELASIYSYLDVTSDYYNEEETYMLTLCYTNDDLICLAYKTILNSPCRDVLAESLTDEDLEYYENYEELTDEQLELVNQEQDLEDQYNKLYNEEYTITIDGQEYTYEDLYNDDDLTGDEYTDALMELYRTECDAMGPVFVELIKVRQQLAKAYGYDSYPEYAYTEIYTRDYTPEDSLALAEAVKEDLLAAFYTVSENYDFYAVAELDEQIAGMSVEDQKALVRSYLPEIDASLVSSFDFMEKYGLNDLAYSETKIDTGFTTWLSEAEEPFIYAQQDYCFYDLLTLVHEFGHFNAFMQNADTADAAANYDLSEIHSQGLEMLFTRFYPEIFGSNSDAAIDYELYQKLGSVLDGCMYDEFQQQVYALEDPTLDQINKIYRDLAMEYGYDYSDYDEAYDWVEVPHNFTQPMYYISYAVSALPALEIWCMAQDDPQTAVDTYLKIVEAGETGTYEETLKACGLNNPFEDGYMQDISDNICSYFENSKGTWRH